MGKIKLMDITEFRDEGYLQESNRLFFHPHGLALEVTTVGRDFQEDKVADICAALDVEPDDARDIVNFLYPIGSEHISGVWDDRQDPEGIWFNFEVWANMGEVRKKAINVERERNRHRQHRTELMNEHYGADHSHRHVFNADIEPYVWPSAAAAKEYQ